MSLYIKGDIRIPEQGFVTLLLWQNGDVTDGQAQDIGKAIEVQPHGALKDADALLAEIIPDRPEDTEQAVSIRVLKKVMRNHIASAPTIIPASGGDKSDPADPVVAKALEHGFYGTMYGHPGEKIIFIKPGEAQAVKDGLFFQWGYPGLEYNIYKPEDYGKTWALTEDDWALTEDVVVGIIPAEEEPT